MSIDNLIFNTLPTTTIVEIVNFTLIIEIMRKQLGEDEFYNAWLEPCHGITVEWLRENEAELIKTADWYKKYAVSQEQHDEWYEWSIKRLMTYYRWSRKMAVKQFCFPYLNVSPSVKKDADKSSNSLLGQTP